MPDEISGAARAVWTPGEAGLDATRALLADVFKGSAKFAQPEYLQWYYAANPVGHAVSMDAISAGQSLGHYGAIPQQWSDGRSFKAFYLSVNSATSVALRGQGAFARLGNALYARVQASQPETAGFIGVPNRNAAPPRVLRLGWTLRSELPLKVLPWLPLTRRGIEVFDVTKAFLSGREYGEISGQMDFGRQAGKWRQKWTPELLKWRLQNPVQRYAIALGHGVAAVATKTRAKGVPLAVITKLLPLRNSGKRKALPVVAALTRHFGAVAALYGGRNADIRVPGLTVPVRMRRSPLTFGFRLFDGCGIDAGTFDPDVFEFFDFDLF